MSLLSSQNSITDSAGRVSIQSYYGTNPILQQFFNEVFGVELQPTIDDYLPLLSSIQDSSQIWQIIEIITKLTIEQNKQQEVQGKENFSNKNEKKNFINIEKCRNIAFIPCINDQKKLLKYTDHPFYPHDRDIANLFADALPIIKLPGK